jgi:UDP-N-acetylglucosamine 3-dehydrogenase
MFLINYLTQDIYFYENDYTPTTWNDLRRLTGVSEGTMTRLKVRKAEPLCLEYEDVFEAIRQDILPTVSGEDGLAVLRIAHQLRDSAYGHANERREIYVEQKLMEKAEAKVYAR